MNNEAKTRRAHSQLRTGPFMLKSAAIFALCIGKAWGVFWLEYCGAVSLVVAWYWLDFNIWRMLKEGENR